MTPKEKLISLGFEPTSRNSLFFFIKNISFKDVALKITFNTLNNTGTLLNKNNDAYIVINNFKELLMLNDFYEKQAKRIARRNDGRNGSETQNQFHKAH